MRPIFKPLFRQFVAVVAAGLVGAAQAQHPIDVERSSAEGEHLQALAEFDRMPARRATSAAIIAAGKSAWALSLPSRAQREFDRALLSPDLDPEQRSRLLLSRGILDYQEGRYQVAGVYAEKAVQLQKEASPLRGQCWLLWGDSLVRLGQQGAAQDKYMQALQESEGDSIPGIHFRLGMTQLSLGRLDEARAEFEQVPLRHEQAAPAIRSLAEIALQQGQYEQAAFWLERGRALFPERFLDSWVDYALVQVAVGNHDKERVRELQVAATKKYPPSDYWYTLLSSAVEAFLWDESRHSSVTSSATQSEAARGQG